MRLTILRRLVFCIGVLFMMRGCTIVITLLPNPFYECVRKGWDEGFLDHTFSGGWYILTGSATTCADVFVSAGGNSYVDLQATSILQCPADLLSNFITRPHHQDALMMLHE